MITVQIKGRKNPGDGNRWTFRLLLSDIEIYRAGTFYETKDDCLREAHDWIDRAQTRAFLALGDWTTLRKVKL